MIFLLLATANPVSSPAGSTFTTVLGEPGFYEMVVMVLVAAYMIGLTGIWIYRKILKPIWKDYIQGNHDYRFWRAWAAALAVTTPVLAVALLVLWWRAGLELRSQHNLYYQMWKSGHRVYEPEVALGGLFYDSEFQTSLIGMSGQEFFRKFPNTFYELKSPSEGTGVDERWYVAGYDQAQQADIDGWLLVIKNGRVIRFEYRRADEHAIPRRRELGALILVGRSSLRAACS